MNKLFLLCMFSVVVLFNSSAVSVEDYQRADSTREFSKLIYNVVSSPSWVDSSYYFFYKTPVKKGEIYIIVNAGSLEKRPAFDQEKFCDRLNELLDTTFKPFALPIKNLRFNKEVNQMNFEIDGFKFVYKIEQNEIIHNGTKKTRKVGYWGNEGDELGNIPVKSPDSNWIAKVVDYNIVLENRKNNKTTKLTNDGNSGQYYSSKLIWSPNGKYLVSLKVTENPKKYLNFIESTPEDSFLPKLHQYEYLRPGDSLRIRLPVMFDVNKKKQINIETDVYKDQFTLTNIRWNNNSESFSFEYNQRGHQLFQVVQVDIQGNKTVVVDEKSKTFIDYSGKYYRYDLDGGNRIIWASERDGWNHLYRIDAVNGQLINQITKGEWVVRGVEYVDTVNNEIIFKASGVNEDEDPYFIHYYKINFDGTEMTDLTPVKKNHRAMFSYDYRYFVDTYSAPDFSPESYLHETDSKAMLLEIEKADISELLKKGFAMPEPYMVPGRDGKTEIWGNIYRPVNFDTTKKYPVLEYIYAGPHSSFVQKWFTPYYSYIGGITELGFVVVQIDGMGTSNRSKAFHDVCYQNLKDAGFEDRIIWIKKIADKYSYLDISNVGIFGTSAGGQSSTAALLFHPEFYKVAVSACGCHDNRLDKIWWNEQWMGYPVGEHYKASSNIENAGNLEGQLMLIVGEIDNNVDPASTYRLAKMLIDEKKDFEFVVLPGKNHTSGGAYGERKRRDFFVKHILGEDPPVWNKTQTGKQ